jgi:hypothetical protein
MAQAGKDASPAGGKGNLAEADRFCVVEKWY